MKSYMKMQQKRKELKKNISLMLNFCKNVRDTFLKILSTFMALDFSSYVAIYSKFGMLESFKKDNFKSLLDNFN